MGAPILNRCDNAVTYGIGLAKPLIYSATNHWAEERDAIGRRITKTRLFKYIENFSSKNWNFQLKSTDSFHISAQNIDRRGGSNEYPQYMFF